MTLTVETNSMWKCICYSLSRKKKKLLLINELCFTQESLVWLKEFLESSSIVAKEKKNIAALMDAKKIKLMWILIHRLFSWALRIKIHVCRLCLTNIYTFLDCPFYSQAAHHQHAAFSIIAKQCQQLCQNTIHSINIVSYFICPFHSFFFFLCSLCLSHIPHCNANHFSESVHRLRDLWMKPFLKLFNNKILDVCVYSTMKQFLQPSKRVK